MPPEFRAKRRKPPAARPDADKPHAERPLCEQCGKPASGPSLGEWRFCKARCRAAFLSARSRRAAAKGKKLRCPACGKGNDPGARTCASCKQRILWRERSLVWSAIVWSMRLSLLLSLAASAFVAWQVKEFLGPDGPGNLLSALGGSGGTDLVQVLGQDAGNSQGISPELRDILAKGGNSPEDLRRILQERGGNRQLEAMLERAGQRGEGKPEDLDAMLERVERGEPAGSPARTAPEVPGPGTWLVGQRGVPPMLFAENPLEPAFWPEGFGAMSMLEKAKAMGGMVTSGKVSVLFGATQVRVVEEGSLFSRVEITSGPKTGTTGWAQASQIYEK